MRPKLTFNVRDVWWDHVRADRHRSSLGAVGGRGTIEQFSGGAMRKSGVSAAARRRFAVRSTKASARLEQRVVPAGHVRSPKVDQFVASLRTKAG